VPPVIDALGGAYDTSTRCPGCGVAMRALALERVPHGEVVVDLCAGCHALWFDAFESVQLTPGATLALFEAVRAAQAPRRAEQKSLACPRCRAALVETRDLRHATRFVYWRCPRGHGRFTPFVQFLREKAFLRPLAPGEIARLKVRVRTVRCTGCGAPVDLSRHPRCPYCAGPIEAFDADAAAATVRALEDRKVAGTGIDVEGLADALLGGGGRSPRDDTPLDLIGAGLAALTSLWPAR
jgi:Zn-finger nucleic acid-binding protein